MRMNFDAWWKEMKPAECDEFKPYFEESWQLGFKDGYEKGVAAFHEAVKIEREKCAMVAEGGASLSKRLLGTDGEKEQQMQQMQQMQVKCIMIDGENAIISADQFDWLCAQAEKVKNLEKVAEAASAEFNAEIARLTDALRMAADEPNIDKARKIADAALMPNVPHNRQADGGTPLDCPR